MVYDFADTFRIIPLNLFLSERFVTNANILRHKGMTPEKASRVEGILAKRLAGKNLAFNMAADEGGDPQKCGMTCGTFSLSLLQELGLDQPTERSTVSGDQINRNLEAVKYPKALDLFFPSICSKASILILLGRSTTVILERF